MALKRSLCGRVMIYLGDADGGQSFCISRSETQLVLRNKEFDHLLQDLTRHNALYLIHQKLIILFGQIYWYLLVIISDKHKILIFREEIKARPSRHFIPDVSQFSSILSQNLIRSTGCILQQLYRLIIKSTFLRTAEEFLRGRKWLVRNRTKAMELPVLLF